MFTVKKSQGLDLSLRWAGLQCPWVLLYLLSQILSFSPLSHPIIVPQKQIGWLHWSILYMYKHQKQRKHPWPPPSPQTPVLGEQPTADEAALGTAELLELSGCSGNFFGLWALPGGLFLHLLVFPHLLCVLVLRRKGVKRAGHTGFPRDKKEAEGQENPK